MVLSGTDEKLSISSAAPPLTGHSASSSSGTTRNFWLPGPAGSRSRRSDRHKHGLPRPQGRQQRRWQCIAPAAGQGRSYYKGREASNNPAADNQNPDGMGIGPCKLPRNRQDRRVGGLRHGHPHPRTRVQMFEGKADWSKIGELKQALQIPVIGSGDLFSGGDVAAMLDQTGCDGVMIARGALGNPWIFREAGDTGVSGREASCPLRQNAVRQRSDTWSYSAVFRRTRSRFSRCANTSAGMRRGFQAQLTSVRRSTAWKTYSS